MVYRDSRINNCAPGPVQLMEARDLGFVFIVQCNCSTYNVQLFVSMPGLIIPHSDAPTCTSPISGASSPIRGRLNGYASNHGLYVGTCPVRYRPPVHLLYSIFQSSSPNFHGPYFYDAYEQWCASRFNKYPPLSPAQFKVYLCLVTFSQRLIDV